MPGDEGRCCSLVMRRCRHGQALHARANDATLQDRNEELFRSYLSTHKRHRLHVASAAGGLLAVTALIFLVVQCHGWRTREAKTAGLEKRGLASSDGEDDSKSFAAGLPQICEGFSEGEGQAAADQNPQPRPPHVDPSCATAANAADSQGSTEKISPGKTENATLMQPENAAAQQSENRGTSEETRFSKCRGKTKATKKKRKEGRQKGKKQKAESNMSTAGEPSASSGGLDGYSSGELSPSSLESYIDDALKSARGPVLADWLVDPDKGLPHFLELQQDDRAAIAEGDLGVETSPSLETLMLRVEEAAATVTGEWQSEESARTSKEVAGDGNTDQHTEASAPMEWSDSETSDEMGSSPSSPNWAKGKSDSDDEPAKKKKRKEGPQKGKKQKAESKTSISGEPSTSSGGPDGYSSGEPSPSSVEFYIDDALKSAQGAVLAEWLADPDKDLLHFLELQEEDKGDVTAERDTGAGKPLSTEALMLMVEEAAAIVTGEWQDEESARPSYEVTGDGSTDKQAEDAAPPFLEARPSPDEVPSTSAASASKTYPKDPHLPKVDFVHAFGGHPGASLGALLGAVRTIMAKPHLTGPDLLGLQHLGVSMMAYAGLRMMRPIEKRHQCWLVLPLAQRVLLAHYLLAVCDVVGISMQRGEWWDRYMSRVLGHPRNWRPLPEARAKQVGKGRPALVNMLVDAMDILRRGERVPAQLIVPIMQQVICTRFPIKYFQEPEWSGFREADEEFNAGNSSSDTKDKDQ
ncbi:hypothetical protein ACSSS7_007489 [Eimeria intestinalis]